MLNVCGMSQVNWIYLKTIKTFEANQKVTTSYIQANKSE
jgi:hypothetical protein